MTHLEYIQFSHFLPDIFDEGEEPATSEIPYGFIMNVLEMRANTTDQLRSWTIRRSILQQALKHVDPGRVGMAITIVRCMPKRADGKVHSLREFEGLGTPPWGGDYEVRPLPALSCMGAMSQAASCFPVRNLTTLLPKRACCSLRICPLLSLAFEPGEFYDSASIELHIMPPPHVQQTYFAGFRQRVLELMRESTQAGKRLSSPQAEQLVWLEMEDSMLNYVPVA